MPRIELTYVTYIYIIFNAIKRMNCSILYTCCQFTIVQYHMVNYQTLYELDRQGNDDNSMSFWVFHLESLNIGLSAQ